MPDIRGTLLELLNLRIKSIHLSLYCPCTDGDMLFFLPFFHFSISVLKSNPSQNILQFTSKSNFT